YSGLHHATKCNKDNEPDARQPSFYGEGDRVGDGERDFWSRRAVWCCDCARWGYCCNRREYGDSDQRSDGAWRDRGDPECVRGAGKFPVEGLPYVYELRALPDVSGCDLLG